MIQPIPYTPEMKIVPPCAILGMPDDVYRAAPGEAQSGLKDICAELEGSPSNYRNQRSGLLQAEEDDEAALIIGQAIHARARGEAFLLDGPVFCGKKAGGSAESRENCRIVHNCVSALQNDQAYQAVRALSWQEISLFAVDPETGILLKGRLDYLMPKDGNSYLIEDLKTIKHDGRYSTGSLIEWAIRDWGYYFQVGAYPYLLELVAGKPDSFVSPDGRNQQAFRNFFRFRFVEKGGKFRIFEATLTEDYEAQGRQAYINALRTLKRCQETGIWAATRLIIDQPRRSKQ